MRDSLCLLLVDVVTTIIRLLQEGVHVFRV